MPTYEVRCTNPHCRRPGEVFAAMSRRREAVRDSRCQACGWPVEREIRTVPEAHCVEESRLSYSLGCVRESQQLPGEQYVVDRHGFRRLKVPNDRHMRDEIRPKWADTHGGERLAEV